jgi:SAM-dependent methyltransferase
MDINKVGRYSNTLLNYADEVVACDNDERALNKLPRLTASQLKAKLKIQNFNLTEPFPIADSSLDGCLCAATLHIFVPKVVRFVISELMRVVRDAGQMIIDFGTDTKRTLPDGNLYIYPGEVPYSTEKGRQLLGECFRGQDYELIDDELGSEQTNIGTLSYVYSSHVLVVTRKLNK